jgi:hypothetical protein
MSSRQAHDCCYIHRPELGAIHIGANGGDRDR